MEPLSKQLADTQDALRRARSAAFVDYAPIVAGQVLRPITLDTYNALIALENAFVCGGPIEFGDVAGFIWLHHPEFSQLNRKARGQVFRSVYAALSIRLPLVNAVIATVAQFPRFEWLRHFARKDAATRGAEVIAEIRRLIAEATDDLPTQDADGEPIPFAFQAYILNAFRRDLGVPFDETRQMPMKQIAEHLREIIHHASKGKAMLLTKQEAAIWRAHMESKDTPARSDAAA